MKKYICIVFVALLLLSGCSSQSKKIEPSYKEISLQSDSKDLVEISKQIFEQYLKSYTDAKVADTVKISDYKIEKVRIEKGNLDSFQFSVEYSLHPAALNYILAGNGVMESNGWVTNKVAFVSIKKEKDAFKIQSIGTGP